jgi:hypothetical protein
MNRADRRRAAAQARRARRRTGYLHRVHAATVTLAAAGRGKVVHVVCDHDAGCGIYTASLECTCIPQISAHPVVGGDVLVIDEQGNAKKVKAS